MFQGIRSAVGRAFGKGKDEPATPPVARTIPAWQGAAPLTPSNDFRALMDKGYRRNVIVYICINEIASSVSQPKLLIKNPAGVEVPRDHPLSMLMRRPNPDQPRYAFLEGTMTNLQAAGNAYIHKVRNRLGIPVQIWNLRPDRMKIKPATDGSGVAYYEYTVPGVKPFPIPPQDIVHLKLFDPLDDYYGMSPLTVVARNVDLDDQATDFLRAFFTNGAAPAGLLTFKEPVVPEERERIKQGWKEMYGTARGWHELAVLDASVTYQEIGSRPENLRMDSIWGVTETRICAAFGVPPILVQVAAGLARATFSNYKEAVSAFWSETLVPLYTRVGETLTHGLASEFAGDLEIEADLSSVKALQEGAAERRVFALAGWGAGVLTLDETRAEAGLPAVGGEEGMERKKPAPSPFGFGGGAPGPPADDDKEKPKGPPEKKPVDAEDDPNAPEPSDDDDDFDEDETPEDKAKRKAKEKALKEKTAPEEGASIPFAAARLLAARRAGR